MATKIERKARCTIESDGELMFWVKIDGKITDLVMLNDFRRLIGLSQETLDGIDQIYNDLKLIQENKEECAPNCSQGSLPIEEEPCEVCKRNEE